MEEQNNKGHILVIEDDELMRGLLVGVLERDGYDVSTCETAGEGLEKAGEHFYFVIMVNLELSGEEGMGIIEAMHRLRPDSCIVAITSFPSIKSIAEAIQKGAYDFITKPFTLEMLRMIVERARERQGLMKAASEREKFRQLSIVDELTGVYNYRHFKECLELEFGRALRYSYPVSLMMVDIDDFKIYNDVNGHIKGNEMLKGLAHLFERSMRKSDIIARYGGEEFAVILPHTGRSDALEIAGRFRVIVREKKFENEDVLPGGKLTVSIGIASCPVDASTTRELVELADRALYRAKYEGKDRVCLCEKEDCEKED